MLERPDIKICEQVTNDITNIISKLYDLYKEPTRKYVLAVMPHVLLDIGIAELCKQEPIDEVSEFLKNIREKTISGRIF